MGDGRTHVVGEQLKDKSGHAPIDANEEIHTGQHDIRRTRDLEHKGCWVHERRYGPPAKQKGSGMTDCHAHSFTAPQPQSWAGLPYP